jgi:hypothetical protein
LGGGLLGFYVAGWGQVRRGLARQQGSRTRHLHLAQRRLVSVVGVVAGAAQEQATQAAAEREAAWELCGFDMEEGGRTREHGLTCV